jgi:PAS domain S-box-containing protein
LRDAARELGTSTSSRQAVQIIAEHAVRTTRAFGAYVERIEEPETRGEVEVVAVTGSGGPPLGTRIPYPGSLTEEIIESGESEIMTEVGAIGKGMAPYLRDSCHNCSGLIIPLSTERGALGALVLLRDAKQPHFTRKEAAHVRALGDLVTAAFRRLLVIDQLREAHTEVATIVESITDAFFTLDREARFTYLNREAERLLGRSRQELLGKKIWEVFPEAVGTKFEAEYHRAMTEQRTAAFEEYYASYGRWLDVRAYPSPDRLAVHYRDVTARKRVEEELRSRIEQLNALAALGQRALAETDLDALFGMAVEVTARELGVEYVELLELIPDQGELVLRAGAGWRAGLVGHATISASTESMAGYTLLSAEPVITEDLRTETRFRGSWLLTEHGAVSGLAVIIQGRQHPWGALGAHTGQRHRFTRDDIFFLQSVSNILGQAIELRRVESERMQLLEREREARVESERNRVEAERGRAELQRVTESRARLMRGFGHDVKNPLGAADGFLQLMEEGVLDQLTPRQREGVERARRAIASALDLIGDLLTIARAEAGKLTVEQAPTSLHDAIGAVVEDFQAKAATKGLTLTANLPADLPTIESDADRIRQVLGNLLSNAVKYTEHGSITVTAALREGAEGAKGAGPPGPGRWIAVEVSDTGRGIPPEQQRMIFQEFSRIEPKAADESQGIGLYIAQRIAEALGGRITVQSEVGRGSTFTLWLPVEMAPAP